MPLTNFQLKYHPHLLMAPLLLRFSLVFMHDVKSSLLSREQNRNARTCAFILLFERRRRFSPVAQWIFLPLRQRRQLWRCDEDCVLAALGFIHLDQPGLLRPVAVHLQDTAQRRSAGGTISLHLSQLMETSKESPVRQVRASTHIWALEPAINVSSGMRGFESGTHSHL